MKLWRRRKAEKSDGYAAENYVMENIITDPLGMYTGVPADPDERPIQDADDL